MLLENNEKDRAVTMKICGSTVSKTFSCAYAIAVVSTLSYVCSNVFGKLMHLFRFG